MNQDLIKPNTFTGKLKYSLMAHRNYYILIAVMLFSTGRACSQTVFPVTSDHAIAYVKHFKTAKDSPGHTISLSHKAYDLFGKAPPEVENNVFDELTGNFTRKFGFTVYRKSLVTKNPAGEVTGVVNMNVLSDSMTIRIDNLEFIQLKKDRYAQFKPVNSKPVPLEKLTQLHHNAAWQSIFGQIDDHLNRLLQKTEQVLMGNSD
jgi:hypothetical protein